MSTRKLLSRPFLQLWTNTLKQVIAPASAQTTRIKVNITDEAGQLSAQFPKQYSSKSSSIRRDKRFPKIILGDLKIMKLENQEVFKELFTPELVMLKEMFKKYGHEIRMAGGAVRDLILNKKPEDIDFATTATPTQMKEMFEKENVRLINMNGEKHGTITPRINDKENFEVTTLRIDVTTDGRHAEVLFTTDWELDAGRRDLTINSMFLDLEGNIYDYHNGTEDLKNHRVRFVGQASDRIQEDYLRILRYFRFFGRVATAPENHEEEVMCAIRDNAEGLKQISGERIWVELRKILSGRFVGPLVLKMLNLGIGPYIGFPTQPNVKEFQNLIARLEVLKLEVNPMTLLSSFLKNEEEVMDLHKRLRLSAFERDLSLFVVLHREHKPHEIPIRPYQKLLLFSKSKPEVVRQWIEEVLKYNGSAELLMEFQSWDPPKFPIDGFILKEYEVPPKLMSRVMLELKDAWIDSNFMMSRDDLLPQIRGILEEVRVR